MNRLPSREQRHAALRREDQEAHELVVRMVLSLVPFLWMLIEVIA